VTSLAEVEALPPETRPTAMAVDAADLAAAIEAIATA
jgi:hypothetical protein